MELHLVLAFDVSASVNDAEFALQRAGTAEALRAPDVARAIASARGGIAIAVVQWSSVRHHALGLDWTTLTTRSDAIAFADTVAAMPRKLEGGGTMIHSGLDFAAEQMARAPGLARRMVIDLSGNGTADDAEALRETRDRLAASGVVINALAVEEDSKTLSLYFHRHVIAGPQSFVITADDHDDFGIAMRKKLFREINGASFSAAPQRRARMRGGP